MAFIMVSGILRCRDKSPLAITLKIFVIGLSLKPWPFISEKLRLWN